MRPRDKSGGAPYALGNSSASTTTSRKTLSWAFSAPIAMAADMTGRIRGHRKPNRATTFTDLNSSGMDSVSKCDSPKNSRNKDRRGTGTDTPLPGHRFPTATEKTETERSHCKSHRADKREEDCVCERKNNSRAR